MWSSWSTWGGCSKSCGSGTQGSTRWIVWEAENNGNNCTGEDSMTRACNEQTCPGKFAFRIHISSQTNIPSVPTSTTYCNVIIYNSFLDFFQLTASGPSGKIGAVAPGPARVASKNDIATSPKKLSMEDCATEKHRQ